jgi:hypothetical protein
MLYADDFFHDFFFFLFFFFDRIVCSFVLPNSSMGKRKGGGGKKRGGAPAGKAAVRKKASAAKRSAPRRSVCGLRGITNTGHTCYYASVVQGLVATVGPRPPGTPSGDSAELGRAIRALLASLRSEDREDDGAPLAAARPVGVAEMFGARSRQQDAHEALTRIADVAALDAPGALDGRQAAVVRCAACGFVSRREEPFTALSLGLADAGADAVLSLHALLREFSRPEPMRGENGYDCDGCSKRRAEARAEDDETALRTAFASAGERPRSESQLRAVVGHFLSEERLARWRAEIGGLAVAVGRPGGGPHWNENDGGDEDNDEDEIRKGSHQHAGIFVRLVWRRMVAANGGRRFPRRQAPALRRAADARARAALGLNPGVAVPTSAVAPEVAEADLCDRMASLNVWTRTRGAKKRAAAKQPAAAKPAAKAVPAAPRSDADRRTVVSRAPAGLVLHFNRYRFKGNALTKASNVIRFPWRLDLGPHVESAAPSLAADPLESASGEDYGPQPVAYSPQSLYLLRAVIVHSGESMTSGHYVCYATAKGGRWYLFNDDDVCEVSPERVARANPYLLLYARVSPAVYDASSDDAPCALENAPADDGGVDDDIANGGENDDDDEAADDEK